jgi:Holliday junction DNA helicase RuvA
MIGYLKGVVVSAKPSRLILDVGGVGYQLETPPSVYENAAPGEEMALFVHASYRENGRTLFGFPTERDKDFFELLITVNGVGPKMAMGALSGASAAELKRAVEEGDADRLRALPGVGKKTADMILLKLRGKLDDLDLDDEGAPTGVAGEAAAALASLGYKRKDAEKIVRTVREENPDLSLEETVRAALRKLSG